MGSVDKRGILLILLYPSFLAMLISKVAFIAGSSKHGKALLALIASN